MLKILFAYIGAVICGALGGIIVLGAFKLFTIIVIALFVAISFVTITAGTRVYATDPAFIINGDGQIRGVLMFGDTYPNLGLIRVPNTGSIVGFADVAGTLKRANIISWDFPQNGNRIRIGPVSDINGTMPGEQWGELEFYTDTTYTFNPDTNFPMKAFRILENPASGSNPRTAFAVAHSGNTPAYVRFGGGMNWTLDPNYISYVDQRSYVKITNPNVGERNIAGGTGPGGDTQVFHVDHRLFGEGGVTVSAVRVNSAMSGVDSNTVLGKAAQIRIDPITRTDQQAQVKTTASLYISGASTAGNTANYAIDVEAGITKLDGHVEAAGDAGSYFRFATTSAGVPLAGDCDSDSERGRLVIDITNNRLYICNGAIRGWDYIGLND